MYGPFVAVRNAWRMVSSSVPSEAARTRAGVFAAAWAWGAGIELLAAVRVFGLPRQVQRCSSGS